MKVIILCIFFVTIFSTCKAAQELLYAVPPAIHIKSNFTLKTCPPSFSQAGHVFGNGRCYRDILDNDAQITVTHNTLHYCVFPVGRYDCTGQSTCMQRDYGCFNNFDTTWERDKIVDQPLPTLSYAINVTYTEYQQSTCATESYSVKFPHNTCVKNGQFVSYKLNVVSATQIYACHYLNTECNGTGGCQLITKGECSRDIEEPGFVMTWTV